MDAGLLGGNGAWEADMDAISCSLAVVEQALHDEECSGGDGEGPESEDGDFLGDFHSDEMDGADCSGMDGEGESSDVEL